MAVSTLVDDGQVVLKFNTSSRNLSSSWRACTRLGPTLEPISFVLNTFRRTMHLQVWISLLLDRDWLRQVPGRGDRDQLNQALETLPQEERL